MNRLLRWYNTNKNTILGVILVFGLIIVVIKSANALAKNKNNAQVAAKPTSTPIMNSMSMDQAKSVTSGEKLKDEQIKRLSVLDEFGKYCIKGETGKAYELISDECKMEMYPTQQSFEDKYYNQIFKGTKINMVTENWVDNIYKVKYKEDALSTGKFNDDNTKQDYINIVKDKDGNIKLNINSYISTDKINKEIQTNSLDVKVISSSTYMDYKEYTFEVTNKINRTILLNDPNEARAIYIEDKNGASYGAYTNELTEEDLLLTPYEKKRVTIKYFKKFNSGNETKLIAFDRVVLNYEAYQYYTEVSKYNDYEIIRIEL